MSNLNSRNTVIINKTIGVQCLGEWMKTSRNK